MTKVSTTNLNQHLGGWRQSRGLPSQNTQTGPHVYCYFKFSLGRVGYTLLGTQCDYIIAILDHSDTAMSFVITAFPAL